MKSQIFIILYCFVISMLRFILFYDHHEQFILMQTFIVFCVCLVSFFLFYVVFKVPVFLISLFFLQMSKFLQEMESRSLIKASELSKGVLSITEMSAAHEWYLSYNFHLTCKSILFWNTYELFLSCNGVVIPGDFL